MRWEAALAYMQTLRDDNSPSLAQTFPGLFDDTPQIEDWRIWQARVASHAQDYKRNRGDTQ